MFLQSTSARYCRKAIAMAPGEKGTGEPIMLRVPDVLPMPNASIPWELDPYRTLPVKFVVSELTLKLKGDPAIGRSEPFALMEYPEIVPSWELDT